jgi:hypothetical protein
MKDWLNEFDAARAVSTPIVSITTPNPPATMTAILGLVGEEVPSLCLDGVRGLTGLNAAGVLAVNEVIGDPGFQERSRDIAWTLVEAGKNLAEGGILFLWNAHRYVEEARVAQAICILRDQFKLNMRQLVLLAPAITLPAEVAHDVMRLDEPLPDDAVLEGVLAEVYDSVRQHHPEIPPPDEATVRKAVEAARGLSEAGAEQVFAYSMNLAKQGLDIPQVWVQKKRAVENTPGIKFYRGHETYADLGGLERLKWWFSRLYEGPESFSAIVFIDELEKAMGGIGEYSGDGGVNRGILGTMLTTMEDEGWVGLIGVGPPGTGKSFIAKATGNTFGVPTITLDLGATKGSLVGQSERQIREAMKVIRGIAGKGAFWFATCNNVTSLPPELIRRFSLGRIWFFDLPSAGERGSIWQLNLSRFGLDLESHRPEDADWAGADIRDACQAAYRLRIPLDEVDIIPVARRDPEMVQRLRKLAHNNWLSVSHPGPYRYREGTQTSRKPAVRRQMHLQN